MNNIHEIVDMLGYPKTSHALSEPVYNQIQNQLTLRYFLYPVHGGQRPIAALETDYNTGLLLRFEHILCEDFITNVPADTQLDYKVQAVSATEQLKHLYALRALTKSIAEFAFQRDLTSEQRRTMKDYSQQLKNTVAPSLLPFYTALGSTFFSWLNENEG